MVFLGSESRGGELTSRRAVLLEFDRSFRLLPLEGMSVLLKGIQGAVRLASSQKYDDLEEGIKVPFPP